MNDNRLNVHPKPDSIQQRIEPGVTGHEDKDGVVDSADSRAGAVVDVLRLQPFEDGARQLKDGVGGFEHVDVVDVRLVEAFQDGRRVGAYFGDCAEFGETTFTVGYEVAFQGDDACLNVLLKQSISHTYLVSCKF